MLGIAAHCPHSTCSIGLLLLLISGTERLSHEKEDQWFIHSHLKSKRTQTQLLPFLMLKKMKMMKTSSLQMWKQRFQQVKKSVKTSPGRRSKLRRKYNLAIQIKKEKLKININLVKNY
ncbi:hypothetical protein HK096_006603, partial [Nowakowskiella sp. JEL0078]